MASARDGDAPGVPGASPLAPRGGGETITRRRAVGAILQLVGAYELLGGGSGLLSTLDFGPSWVAQLPEQLRMQGTLLITIIGCAFLIVALAGAMLAFRHRCGVVATILAQGLQAVSWGWRGVHYEFTAGAVVGFGMQAGTVEVAIDWRIRCLLDWNGATSFVLLNLVPVLIIALVLLFSSRREAAGRVASEHGV